MVYVGTSEELALVIVLLPGQPHLFHQDLMMNSKVHPLLL